MRKNYLKFVSRHLSRHRVAKGFVMRHELGQVVQEEIDKNEIGDKRTIGE